MVYHGPNLTAKFYVIRFKLSQVINETNLREVGGPTYRRVKQYTPKSSNGPIIIRNDDGLLERELPISNPN